MPEIYGYVKQSPQETQIENMSQSLNYQNNFIQDEILCNDYIELGHIHIGHMKQDKNIFFNNGIYISIEGEQYDFQNLSFEQLLYDAYTNKTLENTLNKLDGYFNAIIYDSNINKVFLISDRYGMRMLYYYFKDGRFGWSGEVKGLLELDFVDKTISKQSFDCFIDLGHLLEDITWFEYIKLIKPATIMEFDINNKELNQKYYWKWSEIQQQNISFDKAVDMLGELFINAVKKRFNPIEKIGISLSGGLDSRAIFAAVNHLYPNFKGYAYTFGIEGCDDIEIAKFIAQKTNWEHKIFYFTEYNWFEPRIERVWYTDGCLSMMHMHSSEFLEDVSTNMDFNLNGYAGDVVCGGGWFGKLPLNARATKENLQSFYHNYTEIAKIEDTFYDICHCEPHLYMNRVRRFTNIGTINGLTNIDQRKPFFDNQLIKFIYSISDEYRKDNKLYITMLLKFFPKFFKDIPWQKTRKNVDGTESQYLDNTNVIREYISYAGAIREEKILKKLYEILDYHLSNYKYLTRIDAIKEYLQTHIENPKVNHIEKIFRFVTAELYLKDVNAKTKQIS